MSNKVGPEATEPSEDESGKTKKIKESDTENVTGTEGRDDGSYFPVPPKKKRHHHRRRSREKDDGSRSSDRRHHRHRQPTDAAGPPPAPPPPPPEPEKEARGFISVDLIAVLIIILLVLGIIALILDVVAYTHDSNWNTIVRSDTPFPSVGGDPKETYLSNNYLVIYENNRHLAHAKAHMLRNHRWLEVLHMTYFSFFLFLTLCIFAAYVTRGPRNRGYVIIFYFAIAGSFAIIISLFPLFAWTASLVNYAYAIDRLRSYAEDEQTGKVAPAEHLSNFTAADAIQISNALSFCKSIAERGLLIEKDNRVLFMFQRKYTHAEMRKLGFCNLHDIHIGATIVSVIFAVLCCLIPCIACLDETKSKRSATEPAFQQVIIPAAAAEAPPLPQDEPPRHRQKSGDQGEAGPGVCMDVDGNIRRLDEFSQPQPRRHSKKRSSGSGSRDTRINEIELWMNYINDDEAD